MELWVSKESALDESIAQLDTVCQKWAEREAVWAAKLQHSRQPELRTFSPSDLDRLHNLGRNLRRSTPLRSRCTSESGVKTPVTMSSIKSRDELDDIWHDDENHAPTPGQLHRNSQSNPQILASKIEKSAYRSAEAPGSAQKSRVRFTTPLEFSSRPIETFQDDQTEEMLREMKMSAAEKALNKVVSLEIVGRHDATVLYNRLLRTKKAMRRKMTHWLTITNIAFRAMSAFSSWKKYASWCHTMRRGYLRMRRLIESRIVSLTFLRWRVVFLLEMRAEADNAQEQRAAMHEQIISQAETCTELRERVKILELDKRRVYTLYEQNLRKMQAQTSSLIQINADEKGKYIERTRLQHYLEGRMARVNELLLSKSPRALEQVVQEFLVMSNKIKTM